MPREGDDEEDGDDDDDEEEEEELSPEQRASQLIRSVSGTRYHWYMVVQLVDGAASHADRLLLRRGDAVTK